MEPMTSEHAATNTTHAKWLTGCLAHRKRSVFVITMVISLTTPLCFYIMSHDYFSTISHNPEQQKIFSFEYIQLTHVRKITRFFHNFVAYLITKGTEAYSGVY